MKKRGKEQTAKKSFIAPASIPRRIFAFALDMIIIRFTILVPFNSLLQRIIPGDTIAEQLLFLQQNPNVSGTISIISIAISLFIVFYFSYFEYRLQQTPGKMILALQIVSQQRATFSTYFISNLTFIAAFPFTLLWIIDPVYMFISPKNQRLMERFTKLLVVQRYNFR